MGSILSFAPRRAAKRRRDESREAGASVIIFPGVRYERPPDQTPGNSTPGDRKAEQQNSGPLRH
jgi:hypothetical protein